MTFQRIAVLGGGAWGTALALTCARAGRDVTLWEFDAKNAEHLSGKRESQFLPGVKLDEGLLKQIDEILEPVVQLDHHLVFRPNSKLAVVQQHSVGHVNAPNA